MRSYYEFRVKEKYASLLFADDEGERLGTSVRKIVLRGDDPRLPEVNRLDRELKQGQNKPRYFYAGWSIQYKYTHREIEAAEAFKLKVTSVFEPAGEERGTEYDESRACPACGTGAPQVTPLRLPAGRIPKTKDFSRTIADEVVVSQRVKDAFEECGVSGANFATVVSTSRSKGFVEGRYQFEATEAAAEVAPPTVSGNKPSDLDTEGEYRCADCGLLGLNLLSELSVTRASVLDLDVQATRAYVGLRSGLLRPRQVVLVSPKVYRLAKEMKLKGVAFEIAYLV